MLVARRSFLVGLSSSFFAPAVVKASSLMPVSNLKLFPRIGEIKPIVGAIPEGWVECNRSLTVSLPTLEKFLLNSNFGRVIAGVTPDLTWKAEADRNDGKIVGRYVIYAGQEAINKSMRLQEMMASAKKQEGERYCDYSDYDDIMETLSDRTNEYRSRVRVQED